MSLLALAVLSLAAIDLALRQVARASPLAWLGLTVSSVYAWVRTRDRRTLLQWACLGLLAGFITNIRWQNALFALLPAAEFLWSVAAARRRPAGIRPLVLGGLFFTAGAVVGFIPQMLAWKAIYGSYLAVSPIGPQIRWWDSRIVDILWSSRHGLFATSPVTYVAVAGLIGMIRIDWRFGVPALLTVASMVYFNGALQDWWGSAAFGMRRFDGLIPLMAVGLAASFSWLERWIRRHPQLVAGTALAGLVLWNLTFMSAAVGGKFSLDEPVAFDDVGAEQARALHRWVGHPFSWPVNLVWAVRNGLSPGRYDRFGPGRFLADPLQPYGLIDVGMDDEVFLTDGWHGGERSGAVTFRWARSNATLLVPLDHAAPLTVQVQAMPFLPPGSSGLDLRLLVNGTPSVALPMSPGWQLLEYETTPAVWRAGVNRLTLAASSEVRPRDAGLGGDDRPLALAVDYVRVSVR